MRSHLLHSGQEFTKSVSWPAGHRTTDCLCLVATTVPILIGRFNAVVTAIMQCFIMPHACLLCYFDNSRCTVCPASSPFSLVSQALCNETYYSTCPHCADLVRQPTSALDRDAVCQTHRLAMPSRSKAKAAWQQGGSCVPSTNSYTALL
jgi:hypothetical protein